MRLLRPRSFLLLLYFGCAYTAVLAQQQRTLIRVGPEVQVSLAAADHEYDEVQIASHPTETNQLIACTVVDRHRIMLGGTRTMVFSSNDGGESWAPGPSFQSSLDPVCAYGPDGSAYFGALTMNPPGLNRVNDSPWLNWGEGKFYFALYRSTDGSRTWHPSRSFWAGDRPWLIFDTNNGPSRGRLYLTYQSSVRPLDAQRGTPALYLTSSSDGGNTWDDPHAYAAIVGDAVYGFTPTGLAQLSDGTLIVSNWESLRSLANAEVSDIASHPLDRPTCRISLTIISMDPTFRSSARTVKVVDKYCSETATTRTVDSLAVDTRSKAFKDRIYIAWTDRRSGYARIMFTYSSDRGRTWAPPSVIDDMPLRARNANNFMPTLAVNKNGIVGLTWNDRRDSSGPDYAVRFRASLDGGETWLPSVRVSHQSELGERQHMTLLGDSQNANEPLTPITVTAKGTPVGYAGDTAGLTADSKGIFHALWVNERAGSYQVFTTAISVETIAAQHGSAELASLSDITDRVVLELRNLTYDHASQTISLEARLWNRSKEPLRGRMVGRVVGLESEVGEISITNADNGELGVGALFDFTRLMTNGRLAPSEALDVKELRFHLDHVNLPPWKEHSYSEWYGPGYLKLQMQILVENAISSGVPTK